MKFAYCEIQEVKTPSLPLRECGLKYATVRMYLKAYESLPLRECGLKYETMNKLHEIREVTPLAGVWIEISEQL